MELSPSKTGREMEKSEFKIILDLVPLQTKVIIMKSILMFENRLRNFPFLVLLLYILIYLYACLLIFIQL